MHSFIRYTSALIDVSFIVTARTKKCTHAVNKNRIHNSRFRQQDRAKFLRMNAALIPRPNLICTRIEANILIKHAGNLAKQTREFAKN